jgi:hypothetical protein
MDDDGEGVELRLHGMRELLQLVRAWVVGAAKVRGGTGQGGRIGGEKIGTELQRNHLGAKVGNLGDGGGEISLQLRDLGGGGGDCSITLARVDRCRCLLLLQSTDGLCMSVKPGTCGSCMGV